MSEELNSTLYSVRNLTVTFQIRRGIAGLLGHVGRKLHAVDKVSFDVRRGEVLGVVGESGSGKTTLGKTMLRLIKPSVGELIFEEAHIAELSEKSLKPIRRHMQMVFQDPLSSLNPRHSIRRTLLTPILTYGVTSEKGGDEIVDRTLTQVGLPPTFKWRFPHEMSGGQLQRVAIGRALILAPSLIVADEPVSKLDVSVRAKILNLFEAIRTATGVTLVFITHDLRVARYLSHRIAVMYFGRIVELAPASEIFLKPRHPYTQALLGTLRTKAILAGAEPLQIPSAGLDGCRYFNRCPIRTERCRREEPSLVEVVGRHAVACHEWQHAHEVPAMDTKNGMAKAEPDS
jgi:oligopeptide/dipeptide ABC transporter ATP-binding protein